MRYQSTKTFTHATGLSCCFRQWRAESHCSKLHGYAIQVHVVLERPELNEKNWVYDFGGFKYFKAWLASNFDHKTLVAQDDPALPMLRHLEQHGVCDLVVLPAVGCEAFAEYIYRNLTHFVGDKDPQVRVVSVEVREHEGNSAIYGL